MIDLEQIGGMVFVLMAQGWYLIFKNILDVVSLALLVLLWRRKT